MHNPMARANAGMLAARLATAAGKAQRGLALTAVELAQLSAAATAFTTLREVAVGNVTYWRWAQDGSAAATLVEFTVTRGLLGRDEAGALAKIAYLLQSASSGASAAELHELHDFFARVAQEIVAASSSSGERFSTIG